ncbi:MAG: CpsD/CapB family tyrosine-protein kinase [Oscillospiraceae bacterium]
MAKTKKKTTASSTSNEAMLMERRHMIGNRMNFAAAEAYKLLRTNLMFSFSGEEKCHVIGLTSALRGEGKSLTSMNLAYTIAEAEKKVILIEGDMRLPTVAKRLGLSATPGLSNLLVGLNSVSNALQEYQVKLDDKVLSFDVIAAGDIPPNPSELLGSERMMALLEKLRERYDYILLDLPPVTAVTDAVVASHMVDGMVVVVRSGHAARGALAETMRQLSLAEAHILGFVFNGLEEAGSRYYKKGYYSKGYYSNYYR